VAAIDTWLEGFMHGQGSLALVLVISMLLGLRHASDPDHLVAVTTLLASGESRNGRRLEEAGLMGLGWGLGHGTTPVLLGLPLVLFNRYLSALVQPAAAVAIGVIIVFLAVRLLARWRRGSFHAHAHAHDGGEHHLHIHSHASDPSHGHPHATLGRSPLSSYGVGLVHGIGGSGGITLLLLSTISHKAEAAGALLLFAAGTAVSMVLLSTVFGLDIARGPIRRKFERAAPVLGTMSMVFGVWYALGALGVVVYPL